jgi:hypothetical protein
MLPKQTKILPLDPHPDITFCAVGRALSAWESLETNLAILYSVFKKRPGLIDCLAEFGKEGRVTSRRIDVCKAAAAKYFFSRPDQGYEMRFAKSIARASELAIFRHQLAHGVVMNMPVYAIEEPKPGEWVFPTEMYGLGWPWYSQAQLHPEAFMYGSKRIDEIKADFKEAAKLAGDLSDEMRQP